MVNDMFMIAGGSEPLNIEWKYTHLSPSPFSFMLAFCYNVVVAVAIAFRSNTAIN